MFVRPIRPTYTGRARDVPSRAGFGRWPDADRTEAKVELTLTSRIVRNSVVLVVLAVFGLAVLWTFMGSGDPTADYKYGELIEDARNGEISSITKEGSRLIATTTEGEEKTAVIPSELTNFVQDLGCSSGGNPGEFNCANLGATEESAAGGILTLQIGRAHV